MIRRIAHRYIGCAVYYGCFFYFLILLPIFHRRESDEKFRARLKKATQLALKAFGVNLRVVGEERLTPGQCTIIVANHSSWFDQMALVASLDVPITFVANQKYFRYTGLGRVLRRLGAVPVFGAAVTDSLKQCRETLNNGKWLVVYPEGTRSDSLLPFRRGAAVLVRQTGAVTQPILIHGAHEVLPRRRSFLQVNPGEITLEIQPPIQITPGLSTREFMQQIETCFRGVQPPVSQVQTVATDDVSDEATPGSDDAAEALTPAMLSRLSPSNIAGVLYLGFAGLLTITAVLLSLSPHVGVWLGGQLLLSVALIQWFAILHEAGHKTLFRTRWLNLWATHCSGFFALIPGDCWRLVHGRHHYWTGWQDLDMTTETLVPRPLGRFERLAINTCWRLWIPLFATLYRLNNYWNLPRLTRLFTRPRERRLVIINIVGYAITYFAVVSLLGWQAVVTTVGLGLLISLSLQDLLILSQHTHIPMQLAEGNDVKPFAPAEQEVFTRSLVFPRWFSRPVLLNFDAHGLHHIYPRVPGYHLHRFADRSTLNCIPWWKWIVAAKSVPGDVLLFQNRDQTGFFF